MFLLLLINSLRWVVSPPTYELTRCLEDWLTGCEVAGWPSRQQRSQTAPVRSARWRIGRKEGGKMKEKSLIETAKMQGNVLVRWLLLFVTPYTHADGRIVAFRAFWRAPAVPHLFISDRSRPSLPPPSRCGQGCRSWKVGKVWFWGTEGGSHYPPPSQRKAVRGLSSPRGGGSVGVEGRPSPGRLPQILGVSSRTFRGVWLPAFHKSGILRLMHCG